MWPASQRRTSLSDGATPSMRSTWPMAWPQGAMLSFVPPRAQIGTDGG